MKPLISKADIRGDIDEQIADFLTKGGAIAEVERGLSGRVNPNGPLKPDNSTFQQPKVGRTYVPEVIAAIDERRNTKPAAKPTAKPKTKKKIIYDDFGEPLRWVWVEE